MQGNAATVAYMKLWISGSAHSIPGTTMGRPRVVHTPEEEAAYCELQRELALARACHLLSLLAHKKRGSATCTREKSTAKHGEKPHAKKKAH